MVREVLIALATGLTVFVGLTLCSAALAVRYLRRRNRVDPNRRSPARLRWLVAPSSAARLHRRLRYLVSSLGQADGWPDGLSSLYREAVDQAVALDASLVAAALLHSPDRRHRLADLRARVGTLDALAVRLRALHEQPAVADPARLAELVESVTALEAAHRELAAKPWPNLADSAVRSAVGDARR